MKRLFLVFGLIATAAVSNADCMFKIMNYTDYSVSIKVGFYKGESEEFIATPATTSIKKIANEKYLCNSSSPAGLGVVYINFPNDPDHAGVIYLPRANSVKLKGDFTGTPEGRFMRADNGNPVWLNASGLAINDDVMEVKINFTGRPNSFSAGTQ